ncbi:MAG: DUF3316 domain-containing protein [Paludibacteraceae bacterium]
MTIYFIPKTLHKTVAIAVLNVFVFPLSLYSQQDNHQKYNLITNSNTVGIGYSRILDPYLSPFEYSGSHIEYQNDKQRFLSSKDSIFSYQNTLNLIVGDAKHPTRINSMLFVNTNYDVSIHYRWRTPVDNLICLMGGSWDWNLGGKYISRNVNNPFSLDLYTNINGRISSNYKFEVDFFHLFKQNFRIEYGVKIPLAGIMFVPEQGVSYYELFSLRNLSNTFHFSSIHNRRGISHQLHLDIPLNITTFQIGMRQQFLQYKANNMVMHNNNISISIGCVVHLHVFRRSKNIPSENFRLSY